MLLNVIEKNINHYYYFSYFSKATPLFDDWSEKKRAKPTLVLSYGIMLSEVGAAPIEAIAMVRFIRYLKKIEQMEENI